MGFGVGSLFSVLLGGAWLVKETVGEIKEHSGDEVRRRLISSYIDENTDLELEDRLRKDIENPDKYDEIWARIEGYKRDNPTILWSKIHKTTGTKCYAGFSLLNCRSFDIADIGERRIPFRDAKGSLYGRNQMEERQLHDNREIALSLLIWTYGKETRDSARNNAERIYPIAPSKRKW